jgi:hypothetical protein
MKTKTFALAILTIALLFSACGRTTVQPGGTMMPSPTSLLLTETATADPVPPNNQNTPVSSTTHTSLPITLTASNGNYSVIFPANASPTEIIIRGGSGREDRLQISNRGFDQYAGYRWSPDQTKLAITLYSEKNLFNVEDASLFVVLDLARRTVLFTHSNILPYWVNDWTLDDVIILEHGGNPQNDQFDYYDVKTNCYRYDIGSKCVNTTPTP